MRSEYGLSSDKALKRLGQQLNSTAGFVHDPSFKRFWIGRRYGPLIIAYILLALITTTAIALCQFFYHRHTMYVIIINY